MRTTLTIDDDIAVKLKNEAKKAKDKTFKGIINETLRLGLMARKDLKATRDFRVKSRRMGYRKGLNYDNIGELLEQIEGVQK